VRVFGYGYDFSKGRFPDVKSIRCGVINLQYGWKDCGPKSWLKECHPITIWRSPVGAGVRSTLRPTSHAARELLDSRVSEA